VNFETLHVNDSSKVVYFRNHEPGSKHDYTILKESSNEVEIKIKIGEEEKLEMEIIIGLI
jgi:hypothetical protein